jgi:hypothetical protein
MDSIRLYEGHVRSLWSFPSALQRAATIIAGLGFLGCTLTSVPPTVTPGGECHPTSARMTPPPEALDFFANGSSTPDAARETLRTANWFGNDAMWVVLPDNGEIVGRLDDKIPPYRMKRGRVRYEARQLDGAGVVKSQPIGVDAYGDIGFASGGPAFPTVGCWEVVYTLDGRDPLSFVLRVR